MTTTTKPGMTLIPGGTFRTGSDNFYPEERPRRKARVDAFWIDDTTVTRYCLLSTSPVSQPPACHRGTSAIGISAARPHEKIFII